MQVPFYRNFRVFEKNCLFQFEFFEYVDYTQVVISIDSDNEMISGHAIHPCKKKALKEAIAKFKENASTNYSVASIDYRSIKI